MAQLLVDPAIARHPVLGQIAVEIGWDHYDVLDELLQFLSWIGTFANTDGLIDIQSWQALTISGCDESFLEALVNCGWLCPARRGYRLDKNGPWQWVD